RDGRLLYLLSLSSTELLLIMMFCKLVSLPAAVPADLYTLSLHDALPIFDLAQGRQVEIGLKQTFWDNKGEWTLAAYHIRKKDLVTRDPDDPSLRVQVGSQSSRGLELTVGVELARDWRIDFNGAILDARYDDFTDTSGGAAVSRRGNVPPDVPERLANLWGSWQFMPRWTASAGLRYVGKRYAGSADELGMAASTPANLALRCAPRSDPCLSPLQHETRPACYQGRRQVDARAAPALPPSAVPQAALRAVAGTRVKYVPPAAPEAAAQGVGKRAGAAGRGVYADSDDVRVLAG